MVSDRITWSIDAAGYIRSRSARYPGAADIDPAWTQEVLDDPDLFAFEPDPKSRVGGARFIGDSPTAGRAAGRDRLPGPGLLTCTG